MRKKTKKSHNNKTDTITFKTDGSEQVKDSMNNGIDTEEAVEDNEKTVEGKDGTISLENEAVESEKLEENKTVTEEEKYAALNDKYLRLMAEYDNYRKRTIREFSEIVKTASEKLIMEILPILDNLDRATEHRSNKTTYEEYVKGIAIIEDQLRAVLAGVGLEPIEAVGKKFDPTIHDAVMQIETDEYESGIVTAEAEKGYMLAGKIIRHPKVIVSK